MLTIKQQLNQARLAELKTNHGVLETPFFMPIASKGSVKYLTNSDFDVVGNQLLLSNAYHLYLRPGLEVLKTVGGLHKLMNYEKPILTDSGGFQVFSLAKLRSLTDEGVKFNSHIDGAEMFFTPELSMEIQATINSDIWMCFDYFPGYPADYDTAKKSIDLTTQWAKQCKAYHDKTKTKSLLFGIVQGSSYKDLRKHSTKELIELDFDGYAVGGLAVGEPAEIMYEILDYTVPELPGNKPRYLMGVGQPEQILEAVKKGIDMFDCVLPTRNARHGQIYTYESATLLNGSLDQVQYKRITIKSAEYKTDQSVLDKFCNCSTCKAGFSKAYVRHLFSVNEPLAQRLCTIHNLTFYISLMKEIRQVIKHG